MIVFELRSKQSALNQASLTMARTFASRTSICLCESDVDGAAARMKAALLAFLAHLGVSDSKYHETITRAWVMAVDHFMKQSDACASYADLVRLNPPLLNSKIMLTHYSADVLFSPAARQAFVEPNIQSIPS